MNRKEKIPMKTSQPNSKIEESTCALLVRSEDTKRALLETIVYRLIILSARLQFCSSRTSLSSSVLRPPHPARVDLKRDNETQGR